MADEEGHAPGMKKGLFAPKPPAPVGVGADRVNELMARFRVTEERLGELRKNVLVIEQNMLSNHKRAMSEIKLLQGELSELKHSVVGVEDKIIAIIKELRLAARKEDVGVLKRYLELWDPVKFVTVDQVEKMIGERGVVRDESRPSEDAGSEKVGVSESVPKKKKPDLDSLSRLLDEHQKT